MKLLERVNEENLDVRTIKGRVTEINVPLLYFELDNTIRIYIDVTKPLPEFPLKNDEVEIKNIKVIKSNKRTAIIGPETKYSFYNNVLLVDDMEKLELIQILKANGIDVEEVIAMDSILRKLELHLKKSALAKCLLALIHNAPFKSKDLPVCNFLHKKSFKKCIVKLPNDLMYVNENSDLYTFLKFDGMCCYNVYPNLNIKNVTDSYAEYLFGILDVDPHYGCFYLSSNKTKICVKFFSTQNDLSIFENCLVMFKKWTTFTEIFQEGNVPPLKYILVNFEDVVLVDYLKDPNQQKLFYPKGKTWKCGFKKKMFLQAVKISEIICGYNSQPECWVEALISTGQDDFKSNRLVFIILSNKHITILPFLKQNGIYELFYDKEPTFLKIERYKELYQLRTAKEILKLADDTVFQESIKDPIIQNGLFLKDIEEVESFLKRNWQNITISCCLKIGYKSLQDKGNNFNSWIPKRHKNSNFGTPGKNKQTHLVFRNSITKSYIDLYLTDRDNFITPIGLIEGMIIRLNHVRVFKKKYLKTTVFSSFEILDYFCDIGFSSVNLYFSDKSTWNWQKATPKTMLGLYSELPHRCIVHGTFLFQAVRTLKVTPICFRCKKVLLVQTLCNSCNIDEKDLNIELSICVQDPINPSFYMYTNNKEFLFRLLGLHNKPYIKHFIQAFSKIGVLDINFCDNENQNNLPKDKESKMFLEALMKLIRTQINFNICPMIDAVCVKQNGPKDELWKIIEFVFI